MEARRHAASCSWVAAVRARWCESLVSKSNKSYEFVVPQLQSTDRPYRIPAPSQIQAQAGAQSDPASFLECGPVPHKPPAVLPQEPQFFRSDIPQGIQPHPTTAPAQYRSQRGPNPMVTGAGAASDYLCGSLLVTRLLLPFRLPSECNFACEAN